MIVTVTVGVFVSVYLLSAIQPKVYSANAEVQISPAPDANGVVPSSSDDPTIMGNEIYLFSTAAMREQVNVMIGPEAASEVAGVSVTQVPDTDVLRIRARSTSPEVARDAADAYAASFQRLRQADRTAAANQQKAELDAQVEELSVEIAARDQEIVDAGGVGQPGTEAATLDRATMVSEQAELKAEIRALERQAKDAARTVSIKKPAGLPKLPDSPTPLRDAGVAATVAFIFAVGLAFLLEQLDTHIKSPDQIERAIPGVPVLGSIPFAGSRRPSRFRTVDREIVAPTSSAAEAYRTLATSLRFSSLGKEKRTILITSSSGGEGKTTASANLAAVLAESGLRVVVVSADLRRPMLGTVLHVNDTEKGLTSAMLGDDDLSACFVSVSLPSGRSLLVLPAGPLPHEPAVLLGSDMFGTVLDRIKRAGADFILVDCAPVLPVSDPLAAARHVDGVIVMSLYNKTKVQSLVETLDRLEQVDAEVIGVVLNGVPRKGNQYGYYGYRSYERKEPPPVRGRSSSAPSNGSGAGRNGATLAKSEPVASGDGPSTG
jgi:non-specific protein-tyrosine kinase